jgi:nucleoporin GLE1
MGFLKLELRCPKSVGTIAVDPQPDWTFDSLLSEITAIEIKLYSPEPLTKINARDGASKNDLRKKPGAFSMHISYDEYDTEDDGQSRTGGKRFACDEFYVTSEGEDGEEESSVGAECELMTRVGLLEAGLRELKHEHQLSVTEDVRNQVLGLVTDLMNENAKLSTALAQIDKEKEARRDMDRKLDMQYQRRM